MIFYFNSHISFPIFITGMGNSIVWKEGTNFTVINYRKQNEVISVGFEYFMDDLLDKEYVKDSFDGFKHCNQAVKKYDVSLYNEYFGYVPF